MKRSVPSIAIAILVVTIAAVVLAPWLPLPDPRETGVGPPLAGPSPRHWLGTDALGRDLLSRVLAGGRTSLLVGASAVSLAGLIGGPLGTTAGYVGGFPDAAVSFVADVVVAVPALLIGAAVVALVPSRGVAVVAVVIAATYVPTVVRISRDLTRRVAGEGYVRASVFIGARPRRIIATTIAPRIVRSLLALAPVAMASAIAVEGAFGFLGLSVPPPAPTWGGMLAAGTAVADRGLWPTIVPSAALLTTVIPLMFVGDYVGERLDAPAVLR